MLERIREARRNESGFTLVELLIVIVILGVLAGIVVFAVANFSDEGTNAACKADKKNVEIATESFFAQKKYYPGDGTKDAANNTSALAMTELVTLNYLKEAPSNSGYAITLTPATGKVSADKC